MALAMPEVVDRTAERLEVPAMIVLGAHAHGIGWRHICRLWFAGTTCRPAWPARRPIVVDVGGHDRVHRMRAVAARFAGGGVVKVEIWQSRKL